MGFLRQFSLAVQFLTILPVPAEVREENDLARSMIFYPLVGLIIGGITVLVYQSALHFFNWPLSLVIAFISTILLTGGLHIDGFADMCDGFYAGKDKAQILTIMKDSHIGTMAVLGIFCLLLFKLALLAALLRKEKLILAFLIVPSISRWVMTVLAGRYPYARIEGGTAKSFVENAGSTEILFATLIILAIAFFLAGFGGVLLCLMALAAAALFMQRVNRKIDGITGDVLGGMNEIAEITALLVLNLAPQFFEARWMN